MSKKIDMLGKKFNRLTVISEEGRDSRREIMWRCRCDCGRETVTSGSYIRTGHTKSCGCRMDYGHNFTGKQFGKITVVKKLKTGEKLPHYKTEAQWLCNCICGREKIFTSSVLLNTNIKSCGECPPNEYVFKENILIGFLDNGNTFKTNINFFNKIKKYYWRDNGHGYVVASKNGNRFFLHDLILPRKEGYFRDHINRDKTDNRLENLRYSTASQNQHNIGLRKNNTSGYIGVSWHKSYNKFRALVEFRGQSFNLGKYDTAEEAARVRDKAVSFYFKEFAVLNFPSEVSSP